MYNIHFNILHISVLDSYFKMNVECSAVNFDFHIYERGNINGSFVNVSSYANTD